MEKEKFLTAVFMTIVSFVCSFFGDMIFGFFTDGGIGAAMGFLFPTLVVLASGDNSQLESGENRQFQSE